MFDLVVIGSGPAGEKGAAQAAFFGKRVALIETHSRVGGACVHTGTLPSKTLRETALYLTGFARREVYDMRLDLDRSASLRRLMGRLRAVTEQQVAQIDANLARHKIERFTGEARFVDPHTVMVGEQRLSAQYFLIATGSLPYRPPGVPFSDPDVEDSDTILDLDRIPESLAVVGGGVIGCEYACVFAALGTRIVLVEGRDALMPFLDGEISLLCRQALERQGAQVLTGDSVESISRQGKLRMTLKSGRALDVDKVLYSAGRNGNVAGLQLDQLGIATDNRGRVSVNQHFQTTLPHVYAAGDVIGNPSLASTSMEQGRVAVCHAFQLTYKERVSETLPFGIYTIPEISFVGATEEELQKKGVAYEVGRAFYRDNARAQIIGDQDGVLKLLFDQKSRRLLGVHIIGWSATELVHIGQTCLQEGGTIHVFIDAVFNFPTLSELYKYAAYDGLGRLKQRGVATQERLVEQEQRRLAE